MKILDLDPGDEEVVRQAAGLLVAGFSEHWPHAWPDMVSALEEVRQSFQPGRISRVALDEDGMVLGWIAATCAYDGRGWELHPLVVHPAHQGKGVGRALVHDLEQQVSERGALTLYLGTDDESGMTSLAGADLYPQVLEHLANIRNLRRHPFGFYQSLGFTVVGVIPDANGFGKPDILMAKRVGTVAQDSDSAGGQSLDTQIPGRVLCTL